MISGKTKIASNPLQGQSQGWPVSQGVLAVVQMQASTKKSWRLRRAYCTASCRLSSSHDSNSRLVGCLLALDGLGLGAEVGRGGTRALEEASEERLDQGVEDNGSTTARIVLVKLTMKRLVIHAYLVWGRAIQRVRTNLKV